MCFHKGCSSYRKSIRRDVIEGEFAGVLGDVLPSRRKLSAARDAFADIWDIKLQRVKQQAALYEAKIKEIDTQVETLLGRLLDAETKTVIHA